MTLKLSTLLGALVGVALAAGLMLPSAHRATLVAQGVGVLLEAHVDEVLAAKADPEGPAASGTSVFAAALELAAGMPQPVPIGLTVLLDGAVTGEPAFHRSLGSRLNMLHQALTDGEPDGAVFSPSFELAPAGTAGQLTIELAVTSDDDKVALTAVVVAGDQRLVVTPRATTPEGEPPRWSLPSRLSLLPPIIAIFVALIFRKTLLALFLGIFSGAALMVFQAGEAGWLGSLWQGFVDVFGTYFHNELTQTFRIEIIGFVIALVAMVGVMSRSGGVQGLIGLLVGFARSVRSTLFVTWGMGLLIFFDDYANCLLVGNTMRPLTDRLRISREKLAYIVDSTAAPIAGVSLLSTWIAFEVSTFEAHLPAAGITESGYAVFLQTIPYRFYCLFTLVFVGMSIFLRRDFGPMAKAEERARTTGQLVREGGTPMVSDEATRIMPREDMGSRWAYAGLPILLVLVATMVTIFVDGGGVAAWQAGGLFDLKVITQVLFDGSGGKPIFVGASAGFALAVFLAGSNAVRCGVLSGIVAGVLGGHDVSVWLSNLSFVQDGYDWGLIAAMTDYLGFAIASVGGGFLIGVIVSKLPNSTGRTHLPLGEIGHSSLSSVRALFFAVLILFQAWMIGSVCADLYTADYLVALLAGGDAVQWLPILLFVAACIVAFATGSSWSTMSILLPNVVALAASVGESQGVGALFMVVLCVGAVLEGSIFGDHCSPISDTTVLSSVSSASDHIDHVRTQAPYALVTAGLAIVLGYLPCLLIEGWSSWWSLALGTIAIVTLLLVLGRQAPDAPIDPDGEPAPAGD
jgi:Na+/H+ antiporter NhaC